MKTGKEFTIGSSDPLRKPNPGMLLETGGELIFPPPQVYTHSQQRRKYANTYHHYRIAVVAHDMVS